MEATANFTDTTRRFELTNVDVAALEDVGFLIQLGRPYYGPDRNGITNTPKIDLNHTTHG